MPNFNTPIQNSPFNPFAYEEQIEGLTGKTDVQQTTPILNQDSSLSPLSSVKAEEGFSLLSNDAEALDTINETKASRQGALELSGKMLYNVGNTILFETAKLPGYLVGAVSAGVDKMQGKDNAIRNIVDNFWVNGLESLQEQSKELIPVHISKSVQEGNLLDKISSGQWWASTGADGIGFLLSMMLPGQALKTLGIGAKIGTAGEVLGNNSKWLGKLLTKAGALEDISKSGTLALTKGTAGAIDSFSAATLNTFAEAAAEGANTFDNVKKQMMSNGLSEEEANLKAGDAAAGVFKANMALLIGSNLLDEAWLWKGFSNVQKTSSNKILDQIFKKMDDGSRRIDVDALKSLSGKGWKDALIQGSKNFGRQFAKEGFFEEGAQTTLQQNIEKDGSSDLVGNLYNIGANYFKDFMSNDELHESIFLGGVLGGGMSIFQTKNEIDNYNRQLNGTSAYNADGFFDKLLGRKDRNEQKGLKGLFSDNYINNFNSISDIIQKNPDGSFLTSPDGRVVIDETKLAELAESKANIIDAHIKYDLAIATGDKVAQDALAEVLTFNYLQPFLQQEGGYEVFKDHIPQLEEAWANQYEQINGVRPTKENVKKFGESLKEKAEDFNNIYREVENTHTPERFVKGYNDPEYYEWKNKLFSDKINLALQHRGVKRTIEEARELVGNFSAKLIDEQLEFEEKKKQAEGTPEYDSLVYEPDPVKTIQIKYLQEQSKLAEQKLPKLKEEYVKLFTKEGITSHFDDFINNKKQFKENAENTINEELNNSTEITNELNDINDLRNSALQNGYEENENILLENENGDRYTVSQENNELYIYNSKGEKKKVTAKLLKNLKLNIVSKDRLSKETALNDLESARQAKLQVITEIVNYRENLYNKTIDDIIETNEKLESAQQDLNNLSKELDVLKTKKKSTKEIKEKLAKAESIVKELQQRLEHLIQLKTRYEILIDEYKIYQSYLNQSNISFKELKEILSEEIYNAIKDDSDNISKDIVETQEAINRITKLQKDISNKLDEAIALRDLIRETLNSSLAFNSLGLIITSKRNQLLNELKEIFQYTDSQDDFIEYLDNEISKNRLGSYLNSQRFKNRFLKKANEIIKNIPVNIANKYFGKNKIATNDLYSYFKNKFNELEDNINSFDLQAQERNDLLNQIVLTENEIEQLKNELSKVNEKLDLQRLNKQYLVVEEINKDKVEKRYNEILTKDNVKEKIHIQEIPSSEPSNNPEKISDIFAERQLGMNKYVVGGLNVLYETSGKSKGFDVLDETGLPVQNPSAYQQTWYKKMDEIASNPKDDITKYNLVIYKAKYDNSNELENQIAENNPNPSNRTESDLFAILLDENKQPVKVNNKVSPKNKNTKEIVSEKDGIKVTTFERIREDGKKSSLGYKEYSVEEFEAEFIPEQNSGYESIENAKSIRLKEIREKDSVTAVDVIVVLEDGDTVELTFPVKRKINSETFVFTSIWRPEVLYGDKPRIAPDAILQPLLNKIGVPYTPYKTFSISKLKKKDIALINKYLNKTNSDFTLDELYNKALEESRDEYTKWYKSIVDYNNNDTKVYIKPEGITGGKPLQRRDADRKIIWGNVLKNVPYIKLAKGEGNKKLSGARFAIVPRSGQLTLSKELSISGNPGDVMLVLNNETNVVPVKSRQLNDEEAMLTMYLLSLGDQGSNASIPLPDGVFYKVGNVEIKNKVSVFFYRSDDKNLNSQLKNFSLLHSIINYGEKTKLPEESEEDYKKRNRGTIFAATKTKRIIYTDFDSNVHVIPINDLKEAFRTNNFSNPKIAALLEFIKTKRINVSQNLIEQNNKFPYPKLVSKVNSKGEYVYSVDFDNSKSYYEFLLEGDNAVLTTNLVSDPNYPQFLQRNLYFNPMITTGSKKENKVKEKPKQEVTKIEEINEEPSQSFDDLVKGIPTDAKSFFSVLLENKEEEPVKEKKEIPANDFFAALLPPVTQEEQNTNEVPANEFFSVLLGTTEVEESVPVVNKKEITSLEDIPDTDDYGQLYSDKIYSPKELLEIKLKNGEITQNCK